MIKKNKFTLVVTSIVTLLPILIGVLLWDRLPDEVPMHWGINGEVDGWSSKEFAVFAMPAIMLALHWSCVFASMADPKRKNYTDKMLQLMLWICPAISLVLECFVYAAAMEYDVSVEIIAPVIVGVLFIVIGNLLPKCRQTYTLGIRLPWTLANEENWNKTHRLAGKLWVVGGIAVIAGGIIGNIWTLIAVLLLMVIIPTVYSYCLFMHQNQRERES